MYKGKFVVIDGNDGVGKTSVLREVANKIKPYWPGKITTTFSPGDTPLGAHLRKLIKYPQDIDPNITIDNFSRQLFYIIDSINFINNKLIPSLDNGELVISDRSSFVSAIVYGMADGVPTSKIKQLLELATPPKMHRLYILQCDAKVAFDRMRLRGERQDYFESKPFSFYNTINECYDKLFHDQECINLLSHSVDPINAIPVNVTRPIDDVVTTIIEDLKNSF